MRSSTCWWASTLITHCISQQHTYTIPHRQQQKNTEIQEKLIYAQSRLYNQLPSEPTYSLNSVSAPFAALFSCFSHPFYNLRPTLENFQLPPFRSSDPGSPSAPPPSPPRNIYELQSVTTCRSTSHPTVGVARFGSNVSDRLSSLRELPVSVIIIVEWWC